MTGDEAIKIKGPYLSLRRWVLMLIGFVGLIAVSSHPARTAERDVGIVVTEIKGPIGIAATRLITDALAKARHEQCAPTGHST
jgi:membrane-bound ClpP family serine protease